MKEMNYEMKTTKEEKAKNEQLKAMAVSILQGRGKDLAAVHDVLNIKSNTCSRLKNF